MKRLSIIAVCVAVAAMVLTAQLPDYRARILVAAILTGIVASATDLPTGACGVPVFGAAFPFAVGAYAAAVFAGDGHHILTALVVSLPLAGGIMFALGWMSFRMRLRPLQFGLVTLLLSIAVEQIVTVSPGPLGGSNGLAGIRPPAVFAGHHLWLTLGVALVMLGTLFWVRDSELGLLLRAVRDDELRAESMGYDAALVRSAAVTIAAVFASCAGVLSASVTGVVFPAMFGLTNNLLVLVWIAMGRPGTIIGPMVTTVLYKLVQNELGSEFENQYLLLLGIIILVASRWLALHIPSDSRQ